MAHRTLTAEERHARHHEQIAERVAAHAVAPRRSGADRLQARELWKRATWTVDGHLRGEHGWRHACGPPVGLDELIHARKHADELTGPNPGEDR
jgi:hypothetical protein